MKVKDIAMKQVVCSSPDMSLSEIASMMRDNGVGVIPVCEGIRLVGIITDRDIVITCAARGGNASKCQARDFMTKNPRTVNPETSLEEAAKIMADEQVRRLPVVESEELRGMLSLGDISLALEGNDRLVAETLRKISTPTRGDKSH